MKLALEDTGVKSELERAFETRWRQLGGPDLEPQYQFHPDRKWTFDFCDPQTMVAIEIEGGIWAEGRHTRGKGFQDDCIKYNNAELLGWHVFRLTGGMIHDDPWSHVEPIRQFIEARSK